MTEADLPALRDAILAVFPDLAGARFTLARRGYDSLAIDVADRLIFKFPRHDAALARLRKEATVLAAIGGRLTLPVPDLAIIESPRVFSRHAKLRGEHLTPEAWELLTEAGKARVASQLAQFYAELHALGRSEPRLRDADPIAPWLAPEAITRRALPLLPEPLRGKAGSAVAAWSALPPDPLGETFGFFDGHGWNMAFDARCERLNGVYDFGDSGVGPAHQELIYSNLVSFDLTERIVAAYEAITGLALDRDRVRLLTGIHALSELDGDDPRRFAEGVARIARWAER